MKSKLQVKSYFGTVLFEYEAESTKEIVEKAIKEKANLHGADLSRADLSRAKLYEANLSRANLYEANLSRANLYGVNLYGVNLYEAKLHGANLSRADLSRADLSRADLSRADLSRANLYGAKNILPEYFTFCRDDFWAVLSSSPMEIKGLRKAIIEGRIDGSQYEGECACLTGTIANIKGCKYDSIPNLKPDPLRPSEIFFLNIKTKDTPKNSKFSKMALDWLDEWESNMRMAFSK